MTALTASSLTPVGMSAIRLIPVATTLALTTCHYLQHLMFSSFLSTKAPAPGSLRVLPHLVRVCFWGIIPFVLVLEFSSYGCIAANIYYCTSLRGWYAFGLAFSLSHLVNAPYAWSLLKVIMNGDATTEKTEKQELRDALKNFVRMNQLRIFLTELPLMGIVHRGALA
ncbi:uncharacterized protein F4812DRAFT_443401 [Daldinia caldariorum]|uniref:uncharacterized protein n=1 Tax=Daldinia caldariorum TaxID=326644 RepID=UPI002008B469|nr:uncharacterized protein F4812DRAFT_443401 [Daldinia caldariorum]KAI1464436.1 hypothetical protein F4812DRAFT_443401 [Daldinia caldariorum]